MSTVTQLREFIVNELHWDEAQGELTPDFPLFEHHVVDSLGLLQLLSYIEEQFGVQIADEELVPEHFGTTTAIARLIEEKMNPDGHPGNV